MTTWLKNVFFPADERSRNVVLMTAVILAAISSAVVVISVLLGRPG